ncbi:hypothetical protein ACFLZW_05880 [Chloroflexota bacterium]
MAKEQTKPNPIIYEIKLKGHLDTKWAEWFYDMTITHESDGTTTLRGPLPDQSVLHSVLERIRDMNLTLINVRNMGDANQDELKRQDETTPNSEGGVDAV